MQIFNDEENAAFVNFAYVRDMLFMAQYDELQAFENIITFIVFD